MGRFFSQGDKSTRGSRIRKNVVSSEEKTQEAEEERKMGGSYCELCNKRFRSKYHLKLHTAVHTGEKNYPCGVCNKSYQQKWNLITHMARVHAKQKPFQCLDCGKVFGYSSHFKRHIKIHFVDKIEVSSKIRHKILNPYSCKHCDKNFDSNYRLEIHERKHTGSRPFLCDKCGMGFTTKKQINNHLSEHDIKEYICDKCGTVFTDRCGITQHLQQGHKTVKEPKKRTSRKLLPKKFSRRDRIPCEVCGKTIMRTSVKKHLNIHYRDRVYECRYCKREFLESGQRMVHERRHTGEKPYLCDICGKSHTQYANLQAHIKRKHNLSSKPVGNLKSAKEIVRSGSRTDNSPVSKLSADDMTPTDNDPRPQKSECTDEVFQEILKIAGTWINKKFEESKSITAKVLEGEMPPTVVQSPKVLCTIKKNSTMSKLKKTKSPSRKKNLIVHQVKRRMNRNIFDKIVECLQNVDVKTKDAIEKIKRQKDKDALREFLKLIKVIPANDVIKTVNGKSYWFCWNCNAKFSNRHLLARHLLIHEPEDCRPYKCDRCQKTFTQSNNYKEHLMSHNNENQFYCEKCGNGFRHKSHFNIHIRKHTENVTKDKPKKFLCTFCDKRFHTNYHRDEHVRTHTQEKPYLCKTCGSRFGALSTLNRHSRTHTDAQYQCQICLKSFKQKSSLKRHQNVHSDDPLNRIFCECGKSFSQRPSLKKHKMICKSREGPVVKPFACVLCDKKFLTKCDLHRHTATHDSAKKFKCDICFLSLKTGETYSRHIRRHKGAAYSSDV